MNSLDIGPCVLFCDGTTISGGDLSIPVSECSIEDGRVSFSLGGLHVRLLREEWDALLGLEIEAGEEAPVVAEEETPVVSKKRRRF